MTSPVSKLLMLSASSSEVGVWSASELAARSVSDADGTRDLLLYGFRDCPEHRALILEIAGVALDRVVPVTASSSELSWTAQMTPLASELAGMRLTLNARPASFFSFDLHAPSDVTIIETLALLEGRPWFLRLRMRDRWVYLLGIDQIPDADTIVSSAEQELPLVSAAIAVLLFVRAHVAAHAWFPGASVGNFIIDDPLLRPSYGFVRHEHLAARVTQCRGAATIAFIPWNARRSAKPTIELYKDAANLSICIHGYEHIRDEFSTQAMGDLRWRAQRAMGAMRLHESLTGVGFEPVMVFPQGRFASGAIDALDDAGFLAAMNSTFLATDAGGVRLKHLLEPAVTAYGSLPLFRRRGTEYLNRCRYDLVLGKPVVLVAHHDYFRDDGDAFGRVFESVRQMAPSIQWVPLGEIAKRAHLLRVARPGHREVRFYCRELLFRVPETGMYEFTKPHRSADVESVTINGRPIDFVLDHETLRFCAHLESTDRDTKIIVEYRQAVTVPKPTRVRASRFSVAARRYLSEGRDNYVATNSWILSCAALARQVCRGRHKAPVLASQGHP